MKSLWILLITILFFSSCTKNDADNPLGLQDESYFGTWVNAQFMDSVYVIMRSTDFADTLDGFRISSDGTFIQRTNSGWCGTPPISYINYPGTWTLFPDNTLFIESEFWGGLTSFEIEILSVDSLQMVYKINSLDNY